MYVYLALLDYLEKDKQELTTLLKYIFTHNFFYLYDL